MVDREGGVQDVKNFRFFCDRVRNSNQWRCIPSYSFVTIIRVISGRFRENAEIIAGCTESRGLQNPEVI